MILMTFGTFRFEIGVLEYQDIEQTCGYTFGAQKIVGDYDTLHPVSPENDEMTLSGVMYPHFRGREQSLQDLKDLMLLGLPQMLTSGRGQVFGRWVITTIRQTRSTLLRDGAALKVNFTVSLKFAGKRSDR